MPKKIGRNDPCWCGSGEKYKRCHLGRESKTPLPFPAIANEIRKAGRHETCLHPDASARSCGKVISAHTLQRSRVLKAIADEDNHVLTFHPPQIDSKGSLQIQKRGWRQAATFTAFCENHDSETFAPLETADFAGTPEQCFLIAYRAMCWELFQKTRATKQGPMMKNLIDLGAPEDMQQLIQRQINIQQLGFQKGLDDLRLSKGEMDKVYHSRDYSEYALCEFLFDSPMIVAATGAITPNRTISGKPLQTLHDTKARTQWLSFGVDVSGRGVSAVFQWRRSDAAPQGFMMELMALNDADLSRFLIQFFFAHCENTYFSEKWWNGLSEASRAHLEALMANSNPYYFPPSYDMSRSFGEPRLIGRHALA